MIEGCYCHACGESDGVTRIMMTMIPYFREVLISSFECGCDDCGWKNNEVQFGGELQARGCRFSLELACAADLDRQLIKSDTAAVALPSLDFEIPAGTQRGCVSTVEGMLSTAAHALRADQDARRAIDPVATAAIDDVIARLCLLAAGHESVFPFTLVLDDPAGNSFVENPRAPAADPRLAVEHYERTPSQDLAIGLQPARGVDLSRGAPDDADPAHRAPQPREAIAGVGALLAPAAAAGAGGGGDAAARGEAGDGAAAARDGGIGRREAMKLPINCPSCGREGDEVMCVTDIPHFKEVIIMAFDCEHCGYRSNDIKSASGTPARGAVARLVVESADDFARDVLKSETAGLSIPEIELEVAHGSLGGVYTTVEGLLEKVRDKIRGATCSAGDSADAAGGGAGGARERGAAAARAAARPPSARSSPRSTTSSRAGGCCSRSSCATCSPPRSSGRAARPQAAAARTRRCRARRAARGRGVRPHVGRGRGPRPARHAHRGLPGASRRPTRPTTPDKATLSAVAQPSPHQVDRVRRPPARCRARHRRRRRGRAPAPRPRARARARAADDAARATRPPRSTARGRASCRRRAASGTNAPAA